MFTGFFDFIRKQGVVGLAIGFVLGGSVQKVVSALVQDLINPVVGSITGKAGDLKSFSLHIGPATFMWGDFLSNLIDFIIIALVIYAGFKVLRLEKLDKKA